MALKEVMLIVTIVTGADKPNARHEEPMPDIKTCLAEADRFLDHQFPEFVGAVAVTATCAGKVVKGQDS